jgi:hypothetical protein
MANLPHTNLGDLESDSDRADTVSSFEDDGDETYAFEARIALEIEFLCDSTKKKTTGARQESNPGPVLNCLIG